MHRGECIRKRLNNWMLYYGCLMFKTQTISVKLK